MFLANGAGFGAWAASIPAVKQALGLSASALGAALLAVAAGAMLAMPLAGWLGARGIPRLLSWTGLAVMLALPGPGLAPSLFLLAPALLLMGAAAGSMDVCMNARAAEVERAGGHPIMSSFHAAFSLGGLLGTALVALAAWLGAGRAAGLLATAALIAAATAAHALLDPKPDLAQPDGAGAAPRLAWPSRALAGIGALCLLAFFAEGAIADWSGVFLAQVAHFPPPLASAGFAAFSAAMVIGRLAGDWAVRRHGPTKTLRLGALTAAAGIALAIAIPIAGPAGFFLVGLGAANLAPILFTAAGRAGTATSTGVAAVATLGYAGMLLGPPAIGLLADQTSLRAALALLILALTAIALRARQATT
ncbi:MAG: MFS transporter [Acetobacteraceae bacterium]